VKGVATEVILTVGILVAAGVAVLQLRGVYVAQQQLSKEEVVSAFAKDLESIVDKAIATTGDAAFVYYPSIKLYKVEIKSNIVSVFDKISDRVVSFSKSAPKIVDNQFEDCEKIFVIKQKEKIVLMCKCLELGEKCSDSLLCCSRYCNEAGGVCEEMPICPTERICFGAPESRKDLLGNDCCPTDKPVCSSGHCCPSNKPMWCDYPKTGEQRCMDESEYGVECLGGDILIITVSDVITKVSRSLVDEYRNALSVDGYSSRIIQLDIDEDVKGCDPSLTKVSIPVSSSDAQKIIPQCIVKYNSNFVVIIGGYSYIRQKEVNYYGKYYTDDYYADLNGDGKPDIPIGRIPDGIDHADNVMENTIKTAIRLHQAHGWPKGGTDYSWMLMPPSPTIHALECIQSAIDKDITTCDGNINCYFAPPYSGGSMPPAWIRRTDSVYVVGHGNSDGKQIIQDQDGRLMGTSTTIGERDFKDTIFLYNPCWGGRIHNVNLAQSSVLQALNNGAAAVFGGTTQQSYQPVKSSCTWSLDYNTGTTLLAYVAKNINKEPYNTIGDAWLAAKLLITDRMQREHNQLYGDPSIKIK
jgi:hypothetical protein